MTDPGGRYTVGNIIGITVATLLCAGLGFYALFGEPTGRIGRNWQSVAVFGVLGTLVGLFYVIKGIRNRRH